MTSLRVVTFGALLFMSNCMAQQRPSLRSPVVTSLDFAKYAAVKHAFRGLTIAYSCTETKCNVDRFFELAGAWPTGTYCIMYDSSQVAFYTVDIKDGKKHGYERYYYATGVLMRQLQYIDGLRVGSRFEFYPSGKLEILTTYDLKGTLTSRYTFSEDQKAGTLSRTAGGMDIPESWKLVGDSVVVTP